MRTLLVGYDLHRPGQNYQSLIEALKRTAWWHHLDSTWLVRTTETPVELRDRLLPHIDSNDTLLVIDVTSRAAAWVGINSSGSEWIKNYL